MNTRATSQVTRVCGVCEAITPASKLQCVRCGRWAVLTPSTTASGSTDDWPGVVTLADAEADTTRYWRTGPWDACFGATEVAGERHVLGVAASGVTLLAGAPGAGKSTLSLAWLAAMATATGRPSVLVSGEQATHEIKLTALRTQVPHLDRIKVVPLGTHVPLDALFAHYRPGAYVVDSVTAYTAGDAQAAETLCTSAKRLSVLHTAPGLLISHITKEHDIAGAMALQHHVDTTMFFESDPERRGVRVLSTLKNRFGCDGVAVLLRMTSHGLVPYDGADDEDGEDGEDT